MARADLLLLHGEESFLVAEDASSTLAEWRRDLVSDFGLDLLDPSGLTPARLRDAILQAPFLDPARLVVVRGLAARRADALAPALAEVPPTTRLLLTCTGRLPAASALVKAVTARGGRVKEHSALKGRALQEWIRDRARSLDLPAAAAAALARLARADLGIIDSELRKLAAYRASGAELDSAAIAELVVEGRQEEVFRLTDQLLPRPSAAAWKITAGLLEREPATTIAYRLARHLSLVLEVRSRRDRGESLAQVQAGMREHPYVVQKAFAAAGSTTGERLEAGLRTLLDYEWEVKSGQIDAQLGLAAVLARL